MDIDEIVTVAGAKGGVGKTTTSINVGAAAAADGLRVVVVELDLAMANVLDFLSVPREDGDPTLHDVLAGEAEVPEAVYRVDENFAVAPSGTDLSGYTKVDFDRLPAALDRLSSAFDLVIVDTGAGLSNATVEPLSLADATVLVSTPRVAAIRDIDKTRQLAERVGTPVCGLALTKSGTGASPGPERIAEFLDVGLLGHVPDHEAVPASQDQGVPVIESAPDSEAAKRYRKITGNLLFRLDTGVHTDESESTEPVEESGSESGADVPTAAVDVDPEPVVRRVDEPSPAGDGATADREGTTDDDRETADEQGPTSVVERRDESPTESVDPEYPTPPVTGALVADGSRKTERRAAITRNESPADRANDDPKRGDGSSDERVQNSDGGESRKESGDGGESGEKSDDTEETAEEPSVVSRFRSLLGL